MKNSSNTIGNRTRDLPACSAVPQTSAPPAACPLLLFVVNYLDNTLFNPLNPELSPICHLLALLGIHHFLHVSRIRVNVGIYDDIW